MLRELKREDMDHFLYETAKRYKKLNRVNPNAEIILVGGAAVSVKYDFRSTTTDIDAIIQAGSTMKEVIKQVAEDNELSDDWLNQDFKNTNSYSPKLSECSKFYKTFCQCLTIRVVEDEYLIAMKLRSARQYKQDLSDVVGIIKEMQEKNQEINYKKINEATFFLYDEYLEQEQQKWLEQIFANDDLEKLYYETRTEEKANRKALIMAQDKYEKEINEKNVNQFIRSFRDKSNDNDIENSPMDLDEKLSYAKSKLCKNKENNDKLSKKSTITGRDDKT